MTLRTFIEKRRLLSLCDMVNLELSKLGYKYKKLPKRVHDLFGIKPKRRYEIRRKSNPLIIKH